MFSSQKSWKELCESSKWKITVFITYNNKKTNENERDRSGTSEFEKLLLFFFLYLRNNSFVVTSIRKTYFCFTRTGLVSVEATYYPLKFLHHDDKDDANFEVLTDVASSTNCRTQLHS